MYESEILYFFWTARAAFTTASLKELSPKPPTSSAIAIFTGVGAVLAALVLSGVKKKVRSVTEINTRASLVRIWLKRFG